MVADAIDRRVELSEAYEACEDPKSGAKVRLATEIRLTEQAIGRLLKQVSTQPMSVVSMKAQRAARVRWDRERMARGG
jgi:hypothetical protein